MNDRIDLTRQRFRTPRAAAIAGIIFSILLILIVILLRISIPPNPQDAGAWLSKSSKTVDLALNIVPFAGIAFLWFIGVVRDRLGELEDRFFATVFLGSGLLFLAMLFVWAAVAGGIIESYMIDPDRLINTGTYSFGRLMVYQIMNIYAVKMAGVFMIATSTLSIRTKIAPRWIAFLGYALAVVLLLALSYSGWLILLFPLWILLVSTYILIENFRKPIRMD
jgi:preprotein translocase subunit Sec61beta